MGIISDKIYAEAWGVSNEAWQTHKLREELKKAERDREYDREELRKAELDREFDRDREERLYYYKHSNDYNNDYEYEPFNAEKKLKELNQRFAERRQKAREQAISNLKKYVFCVCTFFIVYEIAKMFI